MSVINLNVTDIDIVMRLRSRIKGEGIELTYCQSDGTTKCVRHGKDSGAGITDLVEAAQWRDHEAVMDAMAETLSAVFTLLMKNRAGSSWTLEWVHYILEEAYLASREAIIK